MVFRILLLCVGLPFLTGCNMGGVTGSGVKISETRDVPAFAGLELHGSVDVVVSVDEEQSVTIEVDDNLIQFITTEVNDNKLVIGSTQAYNTRMGVHVNIQVPELRSVAVSGSGKVTIKGVTGESFDVRISGSGHATAVGEVQRLAVRVSGSGNAQK